LDGLSLSAKRLSGVSNAGSGLAADLRKAQDEAAALLDRIDNRWLQSTGQQLALIEKRKNEELAALEATAASAEQKAAATVKIEQSAAAEIAAIAKRGAEERARETERVAQEAARAEEKRQGFVDRVTQDYLQATGQQIALIERRRETELAALDQLVLSESAAATAREQIVAAAEARKSEIVTAEAERRQGIVQRIEAAWLQATGQLDQLVLSESAAATAREQIVAAAEARKSEIVTAEAERRQGIVQRIEAAWLQATGQQEALIQRRRDAELRMLEDIGLGEEQLARLRVMVNDTAAAEIADIHAREAEKLAKEQERAAQEAERG
jgi:molybdopterin/thiamine biosynthesis adenylyltransferase